MVATGLVENACAILHSASLWVGCAKIEPADPGERDRLSAHRAWFKRNVEIAFGESWLAEGCGCRAENQHFSVGGGIAVFDHSIPTTRHKLLRISVDDHRTHRNLSPLCGDLRFREGDIHKR